MLDGKWQGYIEDSADIVTLANYEDKEWHKE